MAKLRLDEVEMPSLKDKDEYDKRLDELELEVLGVQRAYRANGERAVIVFEGWDAAGKGGAIKRITAKLDPRGFHVWPIGAPTEEERAQHWLWRFWTRLPARGRIAIFDRSWYGRVLVERVEGFAKKPAWKRAYEEINDFERALHDDGVRIVKLFLHITPDEQLKRFKERLENPYKQWKIGMEDVRNRSKWDDYVDAIHDMFDETNTDAAPWRVIGANHKWHARVAVLERVVKTLGKGVDLDAADVDPKELAKIKKALKERKPA